MTRDELWVGREVAVHPVGRDTPQAYGQAGKIADIDPEARYPFTVRFPDGSTDPFLADELAPVAEQDCDPGTPWGDGACPLDPPRAFTDKTRRSDMCSNLPGESRIDMLGRLYSRAVSRANLYQLRVQQAESRAAKAEAVANRALELLAHEDVEAAAELREVLTAP